MGNKADMEKAIILLDEVKESIINAYETKSHLSRNKIAKLMSDETWLNAKKAHEMGFVDGILFAEKKMPVVPKEEEPDEEEKEDTLTAMTYSKSKNLLQVGLVLCDKLFCKNQIHRLYGRIIW